MSILIPTKEFVFQAEGIKGDVKAVLGYSTQIPDNKSGIVSLPNHHELGGTIIEQSSNGVLILEFSAHPNWREAQCNSLNKKSQMGITGRISLLRCLIHAVSDGLICMRMK
jgi:hypothetical protein